MDYLADFQTYLAQKAYAHHSIRTYGYSIVQFIEWTRHQGIRVEKVRYQDLLAFVQECRHQGQSHERVRSHLMALKHLFALLVQARKMKHNPARQVHLKGRGKRLPHGLLEYPVLEALYQEYQKHYGATQLRTLMLSLQVFQALRIEELQLLLVSHLRLKEGQIVIPGTKLSNSRLLSLKPFQIVSFYEWTEGQPPAAPLLLSPRNTRNLRGSSYRLYQELRRINPELRDGHQIRSSVIAHWLRHYDVRRVQYMAGHKWVSSTERYQQTSLENLQQQLDRHHPLQ